MPISIDSLLQAINSAPDAPTKITQEENLFVEGNLERAIQIEDLKLRRESLTLAVQNRTERKKYAKHIFIFTCIWATLIFFIVIANGLKSINGKKYFEFNLTDKVLITLITSTTINFFGFFLLVVKYLFHVTTPKNIKRITGNRKNKSEEMANQPT